MISLWEGPDLEFKTKVDRSMGKTICALANSMGGTIVIGVNKDKQIVGLPNPDEESRHIREILESCRPQPKVEQQFIRVEDKTLIILGIAPFPVSESACFYESKCYIREGSTNKELSGVELIDLLRNRAVLNFEMQRSPAGISDLDPGKLEVYFQKRKIPLENLSGDSLKKVLSALHVANYNGGFYLKNAAVMFFAKEPKKFMPNLKIRIVKYSSTEPSIEAIVTDKTIEGTIPELIDASFKAVMESEGKQYKISGTKREEIEVYPPNALREVITNAVGHRDYFSMQAVLIELFLDKLQVTNPGGLLYGQTIKNFDRTPQHRNAVCYELLHDLGYGEGLGLGIRMIRNASRQMGLPDPEFYSLGDTFRAVLYNSRSTRKVRSVGYINERQKQALEYMSAKQRITSKEYSRMFGVSLPTAISDLNELIKQGKVRRVGRFRSAYYVSA
jgi:ATP-dependent DNA helicase RecG